MEIKIEVDNVHSDDLLRHLKSAGLSARKSPREALGWPEVLFVIAAGLQTADTIWSWWSGSRKRETKAQVVIQLPSGKRLDLYQV